MVHLHCSQPTADRADAKLEGYVRRRDQYIKLLQSLEGITAAEDGIYQSTPSMMCNSVSKGGVAFLATEAELDAVHVLPKHLGRPAETLA